LNVKRPAGVASSNPKLSVNPAWAVVSSLLFIAILLFNFYLWRLHSNAHEAQKLFQVDAVRHFDEVKMALNLHLNVLHTMSSFLEHAEKITRNEFQRFTQPLLESTSNMQTLAWIPRVTAARRNHYAEEAGRTIPGFRFRQPNTDEHHAASYPRGDIYPVYYIEPFITNHRIAGLDLASNNVYLETMMLARDTAKAVTISYKEIFSHGDENILLSFMPTYEYASTTTTTRLRREYLKGFVVVVSNLDEMFEDATTRVDASSVDLWVYDTTEAPSQRLLYTYATNPSASMPRNPPADGLHLQWTIDLPNNKWSVIAAPDQALAATLRPVKYHALYILISGLMLAGIVAWNFVRLKQGSRQLIKSNTLLDNAVGRLRQKETALRVSEEKLQITYQTAELERSRLEDAINSIDASIAIFDANERLIACNSEFRETYHEIADKTLPGTPYTVLLREYFTNASLGMSTTRSIDAWVDKWLTNYRQRQVGIVEKLDDRWLLVSNCPTSEGGAVAVRYDITTMKVAEEQIRSLNRTHQVLSKSCISMARAVDEQSLLDEFCENTVSFGDYCTAAVCYAQCDNDKVITMDIVAQAGDKDALTEHTLQVSSTPVDAGNFCAVEKAILTGKTVIESGPERKSQSVFWNEMMALHGCHAMIALPLKINNEVIGGFGIFSTQEDAFGSEEVTVLEELVGILCIGIATLRLRSMREERMMQFKSRVEQDERKRIAATLHDGIGQTMQAVNLGIRRARTLTGNAQQPISELLDHNITTIGNVIEELRNLSHELRPLHLERMGIVDAIRHYCNDLEEESKIRINVTSVGQAFRLNAISKEQCYMSFREALNNAVRHAQATRIEVAIASPSPGLLTIQVRDNGVGFKTGEKLNHPLGLGLSLIAERMQGIGGHAKIHSTPGTGTVVELTAPTVSKKLQTH
jgi:two-component system, NarL family, sensor kinase